MEYFKLRGLGNTCVCGPPHAPWAFGPERLQRVAELGLQLQVRQARAQGRVPREMVSPYPWLRIIFFLMATGFFGITNAQFCAETCYEYASDGVCDDGGPGAEDANCAPGTDCTDCGPREHLPPPFSPPLPPVQPPNPAQPGWHIERHGRRRYPPPRDYAKELQPGGHPTVFAPPNCSAPEWVGCVAMPRPARAKPAAGVRAALLPPTCFVSSEPGCLRLPKPLARTGNEPLDSGEPVLRFRDRSAAQLSGRAALPPIGSEYTSSIAAADVDGDFL